MNAALTQVWDIISAGRAYLVTDNLVRLLPVGDRGRAAMQRASGCVEQSRRSDIALAQQLNARTRELAAANAAIRDLTTERTRLETELLEIADGERHRIGEDLHDDLGQLLAVVALLTTGLEATLARQESPEADAARKIRELVVRAIDCTSHLARDLAVLDFSTENLADAIRGLAAQTRGLLDVACHVTTEGDVPPLDPRTAHQLYKITQEAVTNAVKHGPATKVVITLAASADELVVTVRNDGTPFSNDVENGRMGLRYMHHRAAAIGATLDVRADGDSGTVVRCAIRIAAGPVA